MGSAAIRGCGRAPRWDRRKIKGIEPAQTDLPITVIDHAANAADLVLNASQTIEKLGIVVRPIIPLWGICSLRKRKKKWPSTRSSGERIAPRRATIKKCFGAQPKRKGRAPKRPAFFFFVLKKEA